MRKFHEDEVKCKCPKCGGYVTYWEVKDGDEGELIDSLSCDECGLSFVRVYKYAWSECKED